jgi:hypothetical protein
MPPLYRKARKKPLTATPPITNSDQRAVFRRDKAGGGR